MGKAAEFKVGTRRHTESSRDAVGGCPTSIPLSAMRWTRRGADRYFKPLRASQAKIKDHRGYLCL